MGRKVNIAINDRIERILEETFDGNATAMAKGTFINRNTINSIVGERRVTPGYDVLRRIVEMSTPEISIEWLMTGQGNMYTTPESGSVSEIKNEDSIPEWCRDMIRKRDEQIDCLLSIIEKMQGK